MPFYFANFNLKNCTFNETWILFIQLSCAFGKLCFCMKFLLFCFFIFGLNLKQTKKVKPPANKKNILSRMITQDSCINRYNHFAFKILNLRYVTTFGVKILSFWKYILILRERFTLSFNFCQVRCNTLHKIWSKPKLWVFGSTTHISYFYNSLLNQIVYVLYVFVFVPTYKSLRYILKM